MTGRVRLTARGVGASVSGALAAVAGFWWAYPGVAGLGVALVLLVLVGLSTVVVPAPVRATRTVRPRTVHRLGTCTGTVELTSVARRFAVRLDAVETVGGTAVPVDVPLLAAGAVTSVEYPIPTTRRGVLRVGPLSLRRPGLAGVAESRVGLGDSIDVRVVPRVLPVRGLPAGVRRGHIGADERVERGGTDLVGLREYVPGDDLRRLHWATSARTGTLMIREDADPARPHLAVLVDDRAAGYPDPDGFEDVVEMAASLLTTAVTTGHPARLLSVSGALDVAVTGETDQALAALADVGLVAGDKPVLAMPIRDLDVVAVVSGAASDRDALLLEAGRAAAGVVLLVDPEVAKPSVSAGGTALLLTAATVEDLIALWDTAVAR